MSFEERAALCALNRIFGFEPKTGLRLIEALGGASAVFKEPEEVLRELGACSRVKYAAQIAVSAFESAAMELERLGREGCRFIGIGESGYPPLLMECEDPPLGLYYKGESAPEEVFDGLPQVAVVGTRSVTGYGRDWCQRIVEAMSRSTIKPLVVSGLALGVDVTAHRTALEAGLPTVAVMATGIDELYPSRNRDVGERIAGNFRLCAGDGLSAGGGGGQAQLHPPQQDHRRNMPGHDSGGVQDQGRGHDDRASGRREWS